MESRTCIYCEKEKPLNEFYPNYVSAGYKNYCKSCANKKRKYDIPSNMVQGAKQRAKRKGLEFSLTKQDILNLRKTQNNKCALTGWELNWNRVSKGKRVCPPERASLDRIDSTKGYTVDNVQLVADIVNRMKSAYSEDVFFDACNAVSEIYNQRENS